MFSTQGVRFWLLVGSIGFGVQGASAERARGYGEVPPVFEENRGQMDGRATYLLRGGKLDLFVTKTGAVLDLKKGQTRAAVRMEVVGASGAGSAWGEEATGGQSSYFQGNDPAKWVSGARQFSRVRVSEVRPGVDLLWYANRKELEYDLVVKPGARVEDARVRFAGAERVSLTGEGELRIETAAGELVQHRPRVWQMLGSEKREVAGRYRVSRDGEVSVAVGKYDRSRELMIDPVISYSTYLGGSGHDQAFAIAVDGTGNAYVAGSTDSPNFPTTVGAYDVVNPGASFKAFVSKINAAGTAALYSTYIGGSVGDGCYGIAIDSSGNAYVTGSAQSADFPVTAGAFQAVARSSATAFVTKLNPSGTALVYSTYLGGTGAESGLGIAVNGAGEAHVTGITTSMDFPTTPGTFSQTLRGKQNVFATKLNSAGTQLIYSTYFGGAGYDFGEAIALDSSGNAYIVGLTESTDFPTTAGAYQASWAGNTDEQGFVSKISADGSTLSASSYLGGGPDSIAGAPSFSEAYSLALDSSSNVYVAGFTYSASFPTTPNTYSFNLMGSSGYDLGHAFLTKFTPGLTGLVYSTVFGGSGAESAYSVAVDAGGRAYVTGYTGSPNFPITAGSLFSAKNYNTSGGYASGSAFMTQFSPDGTSFLYSTIIAGTGTDGGNALAIDQNGGVFITGFTGSSDFPVTTGAYQTSPGGVQSSFSNPIYDAFVTKLDLSSPTSCTVSVSPSHYQAPGTGGSSSFAVAAPAGCPWVVYNAYSSAVTITGPTHGIGNGTVNFTVGSGLGSSVPLAATLLLGTTAFTIGQDSCTISSQSGFTASAPAGGTIVQFTVTPLPTNCATVQSIAVPWISVASELEGYPGNIVLMYNVAPNPTTQARTGTMYFEGLTFTVTQAAAATLSLPAVVSVTPNAGSGNSQVFTAVYSDPAGEAVLNHRELIIGSSPTSVGSCSITYQSNGFYLMNDAGTAQIGPALGSSISNSQCTLNGASSGVNNSGNLSTVTFSVAFNAAYAGAKSLFLYADDNAGASTGWQNEGTFNVLTTGPCNTPQISPASPLSFGQAGGSGSLAVTVPSGCSVTAYSEISWVTINSGASATGNDVVTFTVAANQATTPQYGYIAINGVAYEILQYGLDCATSLAAAPSSLSANAQSLTATVVAPTGCTWTAASNASWLTVSPTTGTGNATLTLAATANTAASTRNATVTVPGLTATVTQAAPVYPSLTIDAPAPNASLYGIVALSGWALENTSAAGPNLVQSVIVSVDGTQVGTATYGTSRADVCNAYPGRLGCPNVGWTYSLNASALSAGSHVLKVTAVDTAGNSTPSSLNFTVTAPPPPSVIIDAPVANSVLAGTVAISGWAIENVSVAGPYAVQAVTVFVDGTQVGTATYGGARADVCNNYPGRPGCPNVGWSYSLNVSSLGAGSHVLKIVATDTTGNSNSSQVNFTIAAVQYPSLTIDAPGPNATLSGLVAMSGWAIENTSLVGSHAVQSVAVFVDSTQVGTATYGAARPDVCNNYPGRLGCPNVGWTYSLNVNALTAGSHVLKVVATDSAGTSTSSQLNFTAVVVQVLPYVVIDAPGPNATLSGLVAMSGWALENNTVTGPYAVQSVTVFVDGTQVGTGSYGNARMDVCNVYPSRLGCPNVGWTYSLNVNALTAGSHVLKVVATDSAGNSGSSQVNFTAMAAQVLPYVTIDAPAPNATLSGTAALSGWALESNTVAGPYAVQSVTVFVDGTQIGTATYGNARVDVCNVYPGRLGCPGVGWTYSLNVNTLSAGSHVLKVVATDSAGNSGSSQANFVANATNLPSITVDAPASNATLSGTVTASGWAIENDAEVGAYAIQSVTVFVDGSQVGTATYGGARADVCNVYPGRLGCPNVGWSYSLNVSSLATGSHTLKFVATDTAGNSSFVQNVFTR